MRQPTLTQAQALKLASIFRQARINKQYPLRKLAAEAGVSLNTVHTLERGLNRSPTADTIKAIAQALDLSVSDAMVIADWLPADELPSLQPYLRSKYGLTDRESAEVNDYLQNLRLRSGGHSSTGPLPHEDEH